MNFFKREKLSSVSVLLLVLSACTAFIGQTQRQAVQDYLASDKASEAIASEEVPIFQQKLELMSKMPSFGFGNLVADSVFLSFLQYFSDASEGKTVGDNLSPAFFKSILAHDPFYQDYYLFLSNSVTLYGGQPEKTVQLMSQGLEKMTAERSASNSFYIWRYKAVDELLFLGDSQAARASFENAAEWAQLSTSPESVLMEKASRQTAKFLKEDPNSLYAQIAAWNSILASALNEDIRKHAAQRVEVLKEAFQAQLDHRKSQAGGKTSQKD